MSLFEVRLRSPSTQIMPEAPVSARVPEVSDEPAPPDDPPPDGPSAVDPPAAGEDDPARPEVIAGD